MDPRVKNLREWVVLLFVLFCVLDIAGVQYGMHLVDISPDHPDAALGQIVALGHGPRNALSYVYVTERQILTFYGFLGASGASLLATLTLVVLNGIRQMQAERHPARPAPIAVRRNPPSKRRR